MRRRPCFHGFCGFLLYIQDMRAIWSGSLSFGLINIPVKIYSASQERGLSFKLLEKTTLCPIGYAKVCKTNSKPVKYEDIVKGYEYAKGDYVVLLDEDFKKANARKTKAIDIVEFVAEDEVDSKFYDKPYYLEPDPKAVKAYALLREALTRSKKIAIAKFVLKDKEHLAAVKPDGNILILNQLRFDDEIRKPEGLNAPGKENYSEKEIDMALALVKQLTEHFKPEDFKDTYTEDLKEIIAEKAKGKKPKQHGKEPEPTTDVADLMAILKESLEKHKTKETAAARR
jgi:DNA end-binding protein Ku